MTERRRVDVNDRSIGAPYRPFRPGGSSDLSPLHPCDHVTRSRFRRRHRTRPPPGAIVMDAATTPANVHSRARLRPLGAVIYGTSGEISGTGSLPRWSLETCRCAPAHTRCLYLTTCRGGAVVHLGSGHGGAVSRPHRRIAHALASKMRRCFARCLRHSLERPHNLENSV